MSETRYVLTSLPFTGTRGPCMTSLYQIAQAVAATKLRFSSASLADPVTRDRPCCCNRR